MKTGTFLGASVMAAVVASFCCILPIVFAVAGVSIVGASAAFAAWRPYLLAVTVAFLGLGFYYAYRPAKEACDPGAACARPGVGRYGRIGLWISTLLVAAFAAFPYYSGAVANFVLARPQAIQAPAMATLASSRQSAVLTVDGLDCPACAASLETKLKAIPGVSKASVSYEKRKAEVEYDSSAVGLERIENTIRDTGARVSGTSTPRRDK